MSTTTASVLIDAPVAAVFAVVANTDNFLKAVPHILRIEHLNDLRDEVGSRFKETRVVAGREAVTELEITEYVRNDHVRIVTDAGGTVWDSVFTTRAVGGRTELKLVMEATPHTMRARMTHPLIRGFLKGALQADMNSVKAYVEAAQSPT